MNTLVVEFNNNLTLSSPDASEGETPAAGEEGSDDKANVSMVAASMSTTELIKKAKKAGNMEVGKKGKKLVL